MRVACWEDETTGPAHDFSVGLEGQRMTAVPAMLRGDLVAPRPFDPSVSGNPALAVAGGFEAMQVDLLGPLYAVAWRNCRVT